jgi:hypothetical protein
MSAIVPQRVSLGRAAVHLCAVDLTRFRWLVSGAMGIELVRASLIEGSLHLSPPTAMPGLVWSGAEVFTPLLDLAIVLMTAIATAIVVQADHPTDARAFWRTRPIPPLAVAFAKIATVAVLFVVIPAAINAARLLAYRAPTAAFGAATLQIAVMAGLICVPAWLVAVVTRTLPRFLGAMLGVVIAGYFVVGTVLMIVAMVRGGYDLRTGSMFAVTPIFDWQHTATHGWWGGVLSTIAGLAILAAHYRLRRFWMAAVALLLLVLIPALVPAWAPELRAPADVASRIDGQLTLPEGLAAMNASSRTQYGEPTVHVTGPVAAPSLPADVSASVRFDRIDVRARGVRVTAEGAEQCCLNRGPVAVVAAASAPASFRSRQTTSLGVFDLPQSTASSLSRGPLQITADATLSFTRHRLAGAIPLRAGASLRTDRYLIEILSVQRYGAAVTLTLVRFTRFPSMATVTVPRLDLFQTDAARRTATWLSTPWPIATYNPGTTVDNWSRGRTWVGRFTIPLASDVPLEPDANLAVVESVDIGTSHTRFAAANVPIRVAPWNR